jgi:hypothetical protein
MTIQATTAVKHVKHADQAIQVKQRILTKADPILLELWEVKRQINEEAHFDIAQLAAQANQFDLQKTLAQLQAAR